GLADVSLRGLGSVRLAGVGRPRICIQRRRRVVLRNLARAARSAAEPDRGAALRVALLICRSDATRFPPPVVLGRISRISTPTASEIVEARATLGTCRFVCI